MRAQALKIVPNEEQRFGRYRLLCRFATGGMASVYLARFTGPDGFEKLVAIKRIHEHLSEDPDFIEMFVDEARLAARISHPNVVQVLELGAVGSAHFIAMEYVDGESLTALIRRVQPPLEICARIVANAAGGLHAAHQLRGSDGELLQVVHRDVSPQNILIGYQGSVKVVDFGVARARGNSHTTTVGMVKGKFAYMAPEQARLEEVDHRADIFALGIVLYEITTRHRLFKAQTDAETVTKVLRGQIVPPSQLVAEYPPELEAIVLRALERDPAKRYQTSEELQADLERFIMTTGGPVLQGALGELMRHVFGDRIEQKRELLRRCDMQRPADEDVPDAQLGSNPSLTMSGRTVSQASRMVREKRKLVIGVSVGVAFIVGIALLMALIGGGDKKDDPPPKNVVTPPAGASKDAGSATASAHPDAKVKARPPKPKPKHYRIAIVVSSQDYDEITVAKHKLKIKVNNRSCRIPCVHKFLPRSEPTIVATANGYEPKTLKLKKGSNVRRILELGKEKEIQLFMKQKRKQGEAPKKVDPAEAARKKAAAERRQRQREIERKRREIERKRREAERKRKKDKGLDPSPY